MISDKHISKIVAVITVLAVCCCLCAALMPGVIAGASGVSMQYEKELFDTSEIISVNIIMDSAEWDEMLKTATDETYHKCDVQVNGKMFYSVGIRPKGNTSLSSIASNPDTDRYSFKLEFDQYISGQTCFGLDKLILNNNYADASGMKEALIYDMYKFLGADASLVNYAKVSVNGDYWGLYLALEAVEDSFILRNYGTQGGKLYKPDSMDFGGGGGGKDKAPDNFDKGNFDFDGKDFAPDKADFKPDNFDFSKFGKNDKEITEKDENGTPPQNDDRGFGGGPGGFGGFSMGGNGANLEYTDDDPDSYSTIWNGAVSDVKSSDKKRVIEALKNVNNGSELEKYLDIDNILKYMAVHIFSENSDSLSGNMAHNYYLYEYNGRLNIIPWDYNLSLGGMGGMGGGPGDGNSALSGASGTINGAIDYAFSGTKFFDAVYDNPEYLAKYHEYLCMLCEQYDFDGFYNRVRDQIDELFKADPTAFYTSDEYETATDMLYKVVKLRLESISGQLSGTIPSTDSEQRKDSSGFVDCTGIDLSVLGSMNTSGGLGDMGGRRRGRDTAKTPADNGAEATNLSVSVDNAPPNAPGNFDFAGFDGNAPDFGGNMPDFGGNPPDFGGSFPGNFDASQQDENKQPEGKKDTEADESGKEENTPDKESSVDRSRPDFAGCGESNKPDNTAGNAVMYLIYLAIIAAAIVFAAVFKRKSIKK